LFNGNELDFRLPATLKENLGSTFGLRHAPLEGRKLVEPIIPWYTQTAFYS